MGVTHQDIANRLGISRTLVTQALHRSKGVRVGVETREEVWRVAEDMGYVPRNVTTHSIGVLLLPEQLRTAAEMTAFSHLEQAMSRRGYRLSVINPDMPTAARLADIVNRKTVDGVILTNWNADIVNRKTVDGVILTNWNKGAYHAALAPDLPCLLMSEQEDVEPGIDQIGIDLTATLRRLFDYLRGRGHRHIGLITGKPEGEFFERVQKAAHQARTLIGMPADNLGLVQAVPSEAATAVMKLMQEPHRPTALIFADNYRLISTYGALLTGGYRIPDDVSLLALLDDRQLETLYPPVTATDAIGAELAEQVAERLIARINAPELKAERKFVTGKIIERASVGSAN